MKHNKLFKTFSITLVIALAMISSCEEEERITVQDTQDISEEALADSYFQDLDDMAGVAIVADDETNGGRRSVGGRRITIQDDRFNCDGIVITIEPSEDSSLEHPRGSITIDFGTSGCSDLRGNTRRGKVIFTYDGRRFQPGATVVTTVEDYYINGVRLDGMRTITNLTGSSADAPTFNVKLENGKATFEDETFATRESDITTTWVREANPIEDRLVVQVSSTASGTTRRGRTYEVSLIEPLEFKRFCSFAVKGIKKYVINGEKEIIIDYGDGTCDRSVTLSVNGVTRQLTVGK